MQEVKKGIRMYPEQLGGYEQLIWKIDGESSWRETPRGKTDIIEEATRILGYRPIVTEEVGR